MAMIARASNFPGPFLRRGLVPARTECSGEPLWTTAGEVLDNLCRDRREVLDNLCRDRRGGRVVPTGGRRHPRGWRD
ncbi:MAG TPA: hypothetical protein VK765_03075, partial [Solirubrobacteraceae bacterium]|nr:hypothetical protein [Solirubrobacteraceae bacterium]